MQDRIQLVTIIVGIALVLLVLEMVRRRRLSERYALIWIFCAFVILGVAVWQQLLERISSLIGIQYPPTAIFLLAFIFLILLLLNVSTEMSKLQDQTRVLAQRLAMLEAEFYDGGIRKSSTDLGVGAKSYEESPKSGTRPAPPGII